jgi:hypothetical protein
MKLSKLAKAFLTEQKEKEWFHGTFDSREIQKLGGFTQRTKEVNYVEDLEGYRNLIEKLKNSESKADLFKQVNDYVKKYKYRTPLFLTDKYSVAKTYADASRSFDYQNATEKVYKVQVDCNKVVEIDATDNVFYTIPIDEVRKGFIGAGVSKEKIDELIYMFSYYTEDVEDLQTDIIAAIGNWLDVDCIDVKGVLDSYGGGKIKSTIRMVLDPTKAKIKK